MQSEAFRWFVRGSGFGLGVALVVVVLATLALSGRAVVLAFIALLLASGLEPVVDWLRARTPLGRGGSVLLVYLAFFAITAALALLVLPGAINQFNDLGAQLAPVLADARAWASGIEPRGLSDSLRALIDALARTISPRAPGAPEPEEVLAFGLSVAEMAISVISILALVFFWLTGRARLQRFALALVSDSRRRGARDAWNEIELRLGSWVRGQLILMGAMGVMATGVYLLIGLEGALLLGVIAALTEAIPLIGPAIGAIPALIVAALTGHIETVLLVAVGYTVIQVVEGNVLVPIVMRRTIGVPPFIVILSILAGAQLGGILGAMVAVPATAALLVILQRLQAREERVPIDRPTIDADAAEPDPTAGEQLEARDDGCPA